jgi:mono/diheme cytochrome c family protein
MRNWNLPAAGLAGVAGLAVFAVAVVTLGAQVQVQPYSGSGDYQAYCASCHGPEARGDGAIAKSLKKRPADLTQLAKRSNGIFPEAKVFKTIDGRQGGHGDSDMPAWSDAFARSSESAGTEQAAARIDVLVKYLQTLQVK